MNLRQHRIHDAARQGAAGFPAAAFLAVAVLLTRPDPLLGQALFVPLGSLYDPNDQVYGNAVSANGLTVVGEIALVNTTDFRAFVWTAEGGLVALPLLSGVWTNARATGISRDGSVIVGTSRGADASNQAVYWPTLSSVVSIGDLPGGPFPSALATDASEDGSVIVGSGHNGSSVEAFRWTGAMVGLGYPPGGSSSSANAVSADGLVVVGNAGLPGTGAFFWHPDSGMVAIPALPNLQGSYSATDVSADGRVVVGRNSLTSGGFAYRYDIATRTLTTLGDFPGGSSSSSAEGVNADGTVVVGWGNNASSESEAFIWKSGTGLQSVRQQLVNAGVDVTGWKLFGARDVSDDGKVVVGYGRDPGFKSRAWMAILGKRIVALTPGSGDFLLAGETAFATWGQFGVSAVNAFFLVGDSLTQIASGAPADSALSWTVPQARSRRCRLIFRDAGDPSIADTTGYFAVKGYELTRLDAGGEYEPFDPAEDGWSWSNTEANQWPASEFVDYSGLDPNTGLVFPAYFARAPYLATAPAFPSWLGYARTFGTGLTYSEPQAGLYCLEALERWSAFKHDWGGSCLGFSLGALMAFDNPAAFAARFPSVGTVNRLYDQPLTDANRNIINDLYLYQTRRVYQDFQAATIDNAPTQTLSEIKLMLLSDTRDDKWLYLANNNGAGGHAVVPYRVEEPAEYESRIYVYDPNYPGDATRYISVNKNAFQGSGSWSYAALPGWGGAYNLVLMDPIGNYLPAPASLAPRLRASAAAAPPPPPAMEILVPSDGASVVTGAGGDSIGYRNGAIVNTLEGAHAIRQASGYERPPFGYYLPTGGYRVRLDSFSLSASYGYAFEDSTTWAFGRSDAGPGQADLLTIGGGFSYRSLDGASKLISLYTSRTDTSERVLELGGLAVGPLDSLSLAYVNPVQVEVENFGPAKSYRIDLRFAPEICGVAPARPARAGPGGAPAPGAAFTATEVPFAADSRHIIAPAWSDLDGQPVTIFVDLGNDGSIDDTLHVSGASSGVGGRPPARPIFRLFQNLPNPVSRRADIRFALVEGSPVRIELFDASGRRVATLADGWRPPGEHLVTLDAAGVTNGVYFYRLTAGGRSDTRKMVVSK